MFTVHNIESYKLMVIILFIMCEICETPEDGQLLIETCSVEKNNRGLCMMEIRVFTSLMLFVAWVFRETNWRSFVVK